MMWCDGCLALSWTGKRYQRKMEGVVKIIGRQHCEKKLLKLGLKDICGLGSNFEDEQVFA